MNSFTKLTIHCLLVLVLTLVARDSYSQQDGVPTIVVTKPGLKLYSGREKQSEVVAELEPGEKLSPVASTPAQEPWYLVRTQKGVLGWIKSSDLQALDQLENTFKEIPSSPLTLPAPPSADPSGEGLIIPVEMNGAVIIVPVLLNRSMKTYMIMDTGASLTVVTPRVGDKLRLKLGSRVSVITANGMTSAPLSRLDSLKVGNAEVHGLDVTVQNFSPDPRIQGLLGLNFLSRFHITIDSKRKRLVLAPR